MMTKVKLKGRPGCSWDLKVAGFVPAAQVIDLSRDELKEAEASDLIDEYIDKKPIKTVTKTKIYTEKELFDMNAKEQTALLNKLGITKIPRLEKDKVKAILGAQK